MPLLTKAELDRKQAPKTKVIVRLTLPDVKAYKTHEDSIKQLAADSGASMAVKMG